MQSANLVCTWTFALTCIECDAAARHPPLSCLHLLTDLTQVASFRSDLHYGVPEVCREFYFDGHVRSRVALFHRDASIEGISNSNRCVSSFVDPFVGTDVVFEQVDKIRCPSIETPDLVGGEPFQFAEARQA